MSREKRLPKLRVNLVWMIAGMAIHAASIWAVLVMFAKLGTPETVGYYTLGLAYTAPIVGFFSLNLRVVQATDVEGEFSFAEYAGQRTLAVLAALAFLALFLMLPSHAPEVRRVTMLLGLAKGVEMASDVFYGLYQRAERMADIARSLILRGIGMVFAMTFLFWWTSSLEAALVGQLVSWLAVLVFHDLPLGRRMCENGGGIWPTFDYSQLKSMTWTALPLGITASLAALYMNLPRYFVSEYAGIYEVGIFSALIYLTKIGMRIIQAVGQTLIPRLATYFATGELRKFGTLAGGALGVATLFGVIGVAVASFEGERILSAFYGPEYTKNGATFLVIMTAGGFSYVNWLLVNILNATRTYRAQVPLAVVTICVCFVLSMLMRDQGMYGMALAWLFAEIAQVLIAGALVLRAVRAKYLSGGSVA